MEKSRLARLYLWVRWQYRRHSETITATEALKVARDLTRIAWQIACSY